MRASAPGLDEIAQSSLVSWHCHQTLGLCDHHGQNKYLAWQTLSASSKVLPSELLGVRAGSTGESFTKFNPEGYKLDRTKIVTSRFLTNGELIHFRENIRAQMRIVPVQFTEVFRDRKSTRLNSSHQ